MRDRLMAGFADRTLASDRSGESVRKAVTGRPRRLPTPEPEARGPDSFSTQPTQGPPGIMTLRNQVLTWVGFLVVLVLPLWMLRGILMPFLGGAALAYLRHPLVNPLKQWRFNPARAT